MLRFPGARSLVFAALAAAGCLSPTPYQPRDGSGGYADVHVDANTFHIAFTGNSATSRQTVEIYLLYRCAEVTAAAGFDYFTFPSPATHEQVHVSSTPGTSTTTVTTDNKGHVFMDTFYFPGTVTYSNSYEATVMIKAFKGARPENAPNAYEARKILKHVGPNIHRP